MVLIFTRVLSRQSSVVGRPAGRSVSKPFSPSVKSICCLRAQLGRARTLYLDGPVLVHLGIPHCNCDPSIPYLCFFCCVLVLFLFLFPRSRFSISISSHLSPSSTMIDCPARGLLSLRSLIAPVQ